MLKLIKKGNSLLVQGENNSFYPNDGDNSYPLNSITLVIDESDMVTFRSVATNDVLFSGLIKDITINGSAVTKDNIIQKFDEISNASTGGGGDTVDAYTKAEADNKFAPKDELTNVQTVANDANTKADALTTRVEGVETAMNNKQDTLVSGTNIKTINGESVLGEGNIVIEGGSSSAVNSVNGMTGDVVIDIPDTSTLATKEEVNTLSTTVEGLSGEVAVAKTDIQNIKTKQTEDGTKINSLVTDVGAVQDGISTLEVDVADINKELRKKQDKLVSGTNIKTINNQSILGEGNLEVTIPDATTATSGAMSAADKTKLDSISNEWVGTQAQYDALTTKDDNIIYYITE